MKNLLSILVLLTLFSCSRDNDIKRIESVQFNSTEAQRSTLDSLVTIIRSSQGQERKYAEEKFLAAFPGTWKQYKALYESKGVMTDESHIYVLGKLKYVEHELLFNKVIDFSINGKWEADFLQDFHLYNWFFDYGSEFIDVFAKRDDKTIKNLFRFIFDGAHPRAMIDRYRALHCKLTKENERLAHLLKETYNHLLKIESADGHGH